MNSFQCGHVIAEANGGVIHVDNLRPICSICNQSMGTENMDDFRKRCGFIKKPTQKIEIPNNSSKLPPLYSISPPTSKMFSGDLGSKPLFSLSPQRPLFSGSSMTELMSHPIPSMTELMSRPIPSMTELMSHPMWDKY
jgi:hypothetical protein